MQRALITGATGFVGSNLVEFLLARDWQVRCLVRDSGKAQKIAAAGAELRVGSLPDANALGEAVRDVDVVFHVAGRVTALRRHDFQADNVDGTRAVLEASAARHQPAVIIVSSLAAGGPSEPGAPRRETDPNCPVSAYGRSKLAAELAAAEFADQVPLSIVRPPVVFGKGDRNSLALFKTVRATHLHLVPGYRDLPMSIVHVADLCDALLRAALSGRRVDKMSGDAGMAAGTYYVTSGRTISYQEFGRLAALGLGRSVYVVPVPKAIFWLAGGAAEGVAQLRRRAGILNWDKVREAVAGSWECDDEKIRRELDYQPQASLEQRFADTARWYRKQGWL